MCTKHQNKKQHISLTDLSCKQCDNLAFFSKNIIMKVLKKCDLSNIPCHVQFFQGIDDALISMSKVIHDHTNRYKFIATIS